MRRLLTALAVWLALTAPAWAADHCIRDGGTGDGSAWDNALDDLPATLVRGDIYYIADGTYAAYTFNDAVDGTTLITIKKATVASHGPATGWSDAYGDGQAIFGTLTVTTSYWHIDGAVGGGPGAWETGHGICIDATVGVVAMNAGTTAYVTFSHVEVDIGAVGPSDSYAFALYRTNNWTFEYCWIHDIGKDVWSIAYTADDLVVQYCKVARNHQDPTYHGDLVEAQSGTFNRWTFRYNLFEDVVGSYLFGNHGDAVNGYKIYGNILHFKNVGPSLGNGVVGVLSGGGSVSGLRFYHNTITGIFNSSTQGFYSTLRGSDNLARNNLWHEGTDADYAFSYGDATHDHNTHVNMPTQSGEENTTGDPFTAVASGDVSLVANTTAGATLDSEYATDMLGHTRVTWSRGALEYVTAAPTAPTNVRIR